MISYPHLTEEETEAQKGDMTGLRPEQRSGRPGLASGLLSLLLLWALPCPSLPRAQTGVFSRSLSLSLTPPAPAAFPFPAHPPCQARGQALTDPRCLFQQCLRLRSLTPSAPLPTTRSSCAGGCPPTHHLPGTIPLSSGARMCRPSRAPPAGSGGKR